MFEYECDPTNYINIDNYKKIIHIIYEEHNKYIKEWICNQDSSYNLKKTCICDVCLNSDNKYFIIENFKQYINIYVSSLNSLQFKIMDRIYKECNIFISGRIKNEESIILKMNKKNNDSEGKFPIIKCLNDLLGFRIIDPQFNNNIGGLITYLDEVILNYNFRIKHLDRVNGQYMAFHIYFQGIDNKSFPIELQVWDSKNENVNLMSHAIYKKKYTVWPQKYENLLERGE